MTKVYITKEEVNLMKKIKGNVKGDLIKSFHDYIIREKGEEGVALVERRFKELGWPIKFKDVFTFKWYPESFLCLTHVVFLEVFDFDESKAFELGYNVPLGSIIIKMIMRYFISPEKALKNISKFWQKYFDFGKMECIDYNIEKGYAFLKLDGFKKFHPLVYEYLRGYISKTAEMIINSKNIKTEQIKSLYKNDPYDEFKVTWE